MTKDEISSPEDDKRSLAQLLELGLNLRVQLEAGLSPEWNLLERPYALAAMMTGAKDEPMELRSHTFESMVDAFVGLRLGPLVEHYVKLHDDLVEHAHVDSASKFEFGNDAYVWALAERFAPEKDRGFNFKAIFGEDYEPEPPDPQACRAKAIVLQTQSCNFLVVLNYAYGRWTRLDVREFWPDVREALAEDGYLLNLNDLRDRKDLTVLDVVKYSTRAATYSDDFGAEGNYSRVERPSLATLVNGSLMAGEDDAGIALRYGDFRDSGFVVSVKLDRDRGPETDGMVHNRISAVGYVVSNMSSAMYVLSEEYPATDVDATAASDDPGT